MKRLLSVVACLMVLEASADVLRTKNGSILQGSVSSLSLDSVKFKTSEFGEVVVKISDVESLEDSGKHRLRLLETNELIEKSVVVSNSQMKVDGIQLAEIKAIDEVPETWHGNITAGFNATRGNTYENSGSLLASANRKWEKDRFNSDFGYYYAESGKVNEDRKKTIDRWEVQAKHQHFWREKVYNYELGKYERDVMQDLKYRFRGGFGLGYYWFDESVFDKFGKLTFNQDLGIDYVKDEYDYENSECKDNGYAAVQYSHHLSWIPKWTEGMKVFHNFEYLPEVDEFSKYLLKSDFGFSKDLISDFSLLMKVEWERNSCPAKDHKKDDLRYIVGLGWKW